MRQIDADALKRKLQKIGINAWKKQITASVETILNQVIDIVDALPTVNTVPQWIPCSKKLPKEADEYLITLKDRHGDTYVKKTMYFPDDELWWDISPFETVTAWMPVPEPYREL